MRNAWKSPIAGAALIIVLTVLAYLPVMHGGFVWDDDSWTTGIKGLLRDVSGLRAMWCRLTALQQYYPLSGTTFWLDYHLWGFWTLPYHVENVLLHAASAVLFWQLLRRLKTPGAWLAGAVFALHPVMVESAGWITERKNVLSLVFYLGALLAYGRFNSFWKEDNGSRAQHRGAYGLALLLCLCALLAKTTAFSLPAVIVLIGWWKRGRVRWREDVLPTLPMFALAISFCLMTARLEKTHVGAQGPDFALTFPERCLIAGRVPWFYIGKLLWPANLCFVYPQWQPDAGSWQQWLYPAATAGVLVALWLARRWIGRGPAMAAFFYMGTLFPLLGFFNAYGMRYSFVWNHWAYLPSLGLIALFAGAVSSCADTWQLGQNVRCTLSALLLLVLAALTWQWARVYQDSETLWRDTETKNPNAWMPHYNRGLDLWQAGRVQESIGEFQEVLRIKPDDAAVHDDLGLAFVKIGKLQEAIEQYKEALQIKPDDVAAHSDLGAAFAKLGRLQEAIEHYERALRINPDYGVAHNDLGLALVRLGRVPEAIAQYEQALRSNPDDADAHNNLGIALAQAGRIPEAIEHLEHALRVKPDLADAHYNLGIALAQTGKIGEAIAHYEQALRIKPDDADARYNLGLALEKLGRAPEAIEQFEQAIKLRPDFAPARTALARLQARQ
ncbi:MAG: tetratricopeptide repeat protein [Verrucomicrobiia bacterium]